MAAVLDAVYAVFIYEGKINGKTELISDKIGTLTEYFIPHKHDKILLEKEVYTIKDTLFDYDNHCIDLFVEKYDWEG